MPVEVKRFQNTQATGDVAVFKSLQFKHSPPGNHDQEKMTRP